MDCCRNTVALAWQPYFCMILGLNLCIIAAVRTVLAWTSSSMVSCRSRISPDFDRVYFRFCFCGRSWPLKADEGVAHPRFAPDSSLLPSWQPSWETVLGFVCSFFCVCCLNLGRISSILCLCLVFQFSHFWLFSNFQPKISNFSWKNSIL